jgi:adenylate cyclase
MTSVESFSNSVLESFDARRSGMLKSERGLLAKSATTGNPEFDDLAIGESRRAELASVFLDLREFTARSFWDDEFEVADLANAVLSGLAGFVQQYGGHVIGLRGDGLLATFGGRAAGEIAVLSAASACAASLQAVESGLNPDLIRRGIRPVQLRAGADFGSAVFERSGTPMSSEVNVTGFSTNFASKCEKSANSWEVIVGQGFAQHIPNQDMLTKCDKSPKRYERDGQAKTYEFYAYSWRRLAVHLDAHTARELTQLYPELNRMRGN